jgi:hypothetical protein
MTALTLRDAEAADSLALARLDDDGAPVAVTSRPAAPRRPHPGRRIAAPVKNEPVPAATSQGAAPRQSTKHTMARQAETDRNDIGGCSA